MRSLRFDTAAFIAEYRQAHEAGMNLRELAALLGITYSTLCCRKHALSKRGIRLPKLPNGNCKRKAARPVVRLVEPMSIQVERTPVHFTIDVGAHA